MTSRIQRYLADEQPQTPCLVVDLEAVAAAYESLQRALPMATIYYAMKANPAQPVLQLLAGMGSSFDCASIYEIEQALSAGAPVERLSFGNTIKKQDHIARARAWGVDMFAFDSEAELTKLAAVAPGAKVYCRLVMDGSGADWPLARKFGCEIEMAYDLMLKARDLGLDPYGLSFHVGSQQRDVGQWDLAVGRTAMLFTNLAEAGVNLRMVNIGGGFTAKYRTDAPDQNDHATAVIEALNKHFGNRMPEVIVEPGRSMVGDAGIIQAEVVLISKKSYEDEKRWVYLDIGKFGGLIETMDEAIKYRVRTPYDGEATSTSPVIIAGPTCDEVDVLYRNCNYELPDALNVGDKIEILSTGAYTTTYCSVAFNGLPPLQTHCI
jgi:ornithine decarboxylase